MGICFSKRGEPSSATKAPSTDPPKEKAAVTKQEKEPKTAEENPVFTEATVASTEKKAPSDEEAVEKEKPEVPVRKNSLLEEEKSSKSAEASAAADEQRPAPPRASSCTKEEIEAILIQCGRLSRSPSGKISNEAAQPGRQRRHSGSKRSYDFDKEGKEEEEVDKAVSRPSPRRRTPGGERSRSRERGRRGSRSPVKRSDGPTSSASVGEKLKQPQPAKLVSVPAREKGAPFNNGENDAKKVPGGLKTASPRSQSPANAGRVCNENPLPQSLSRNSSRKAEQSPFRRNPLVDIDENPTRNQRDGNNTGMFQTRKEMDDVLKKHRGGAATTKKLESVEQDRTLTRTRSSRRSSRDFDNNPAFINPTSYASFLIEDMPNQQHLELQEFSLPACLSKACSILEAVADLNSSESKTYGTNQSNNKNVFLKDRLQRRGVFPPNESFVESEMEVKNDITEPRLHKYVTVRGARREVEPPQESAGSNSFVGQPWSSSSPREVNSVDSTDRSWPCSRNGRDASLEEEEEEEEEEEIERVESWKHRYRATSAEKGAGVATPSGKKKREFDGHLGLYQYRSGNGRALSAPACAAKS